MGWVFPRTAVELPLKAAIGALVVCAALTEPLLSKPLAWDEVSEARSQEADNSSAYRSRPAPLDPRLAEQAPSATELRVLVILRGQPQKGILQQYEAAAGLALRVLEGRWKQAERLAAVDRAGALRARRDFELAWQNLRRQAFAAVEQSIQAEQDSVVQELKRLGARNIRRFVAVNMIAATLPSSVVEELRQHPAVAEVTVDEVHVGHLRVSVPSLGAGDLWLAGYTGAAQGVAILDTGIRAQHPAFANLALEAGVFLETGQQDKCFADDTSTQDRYGHGTHVAGIVGSRGSSSWSDYLGVARELGQLVMLKAAFRSSGVGSCSSGAYTLSSDVAAALEWLVRERPWIKIVNYSFGAETTQDDTPSARRFDFLADTYDLLIVVSAGNSGPAEKTVSSPAVGYNLLSVGAVHTGPTADRSDDFVLSFSSRGPTAGGRKKPDLVAPGSAQHWVAGNLVSGIYAPDYASDGFVRKSGTSMAAPHVAGAAALLRNAGVVDPLSLKALLVNTTDTRGWSADKGWGYLNLSRALAQSGYVVRSELDSAPRFFRAEAKDTFSSTLVWNRSLASPTAASGCLSLLDQYLYHATSGEPLGYWAAGIDNVVQVDATVAGPVVLKLKPAGTLCRASEPFGLAANVPLSPVSGPRLKLSCLVPSVVEPGQTFTGTCTASNEGDLPVVGARIAVSSDQQGLLAEMDIGTLNPRSTTTFGWQAKAGSSAGRILLRALLTGNSYGEEWSANTELVTQVLSLPGHGGGCTYSAVLDLVAFPPAGGSASLLIRTDPQCTWRVEGLPSWLSVLAISTESHFARVVLAAERNQGSSRLALLRVGPLTLPVRQLGEDGCGGSLQCSLKVLPHLAFGGQWSTELRLASREDTPTQFRARFFGDEGKPALLPITGAGRQAELSGSLPARGLRSFQASDPAGSEQGAWALVEAGPGVQPYLVFRRRTAEGLFYEAAVHATQQGATAFSFPLDATVFEPAQAQMFTGFAVVNLNPEQAAQLRCVARDAEGEPIAGWELRLTLPALGHWAGYWFAELQDREGQIECAADTLVSAVALRFIGDKAFSTLPVAP